MKRFNYLLIFLILTSYVFSGAFFEKFNAKSENDKITLEWKTKDEVNVKSFVVERKGVNGDFIPLGEINPKGDNSFYQYVDETAFKTNSSLYHYRIKIVDLDGTISYSSEISVVHSVSSVKRTWGSIKAMFR